MHILFLFFYLLVFLFTLYAFARDDFLLLKKNISLEQLFNAAFVILFIGLLAARLFYVVFHFHISYLNPLVFFLFPYFPGLSLPGGIVGVLVFAYFYLSAKKIPLGKTADFFGLSFLASLWTGLVVQAVVLSFLQKHIVLMEVVESVLFGVLFFLFTGVIVPYQRRGELQDGSIVLMLLSLFAIISFILPFVLQKVALVPFLVGDGGILLLLFAVSLGLFVKQEKVGAMFKNIFVKRGTS